MGRPYLQYVGDRAPKYVCACCSCDIASSSTLVWEGIMGARQPAVLLRETVNLEAEGGVRQERLSTGRYSLVDVACRSCGTRLGWRYEEAASLDQKYKEGCTLLQASLLSLVKDSEEQVADCHTQQPNMVAVRC